MRHLLCGLICLLCLLPASGLGENPFAVGAEEPDKLILNDSGFLPEGDLRDEYIWQDEENGLWQYVTKSLFIRVTRKQDDTPLTWFETEVRASAQSPLNTYVTEGSTPGRRLVNPLGFARQNHVLLAITDDFSGYRIQKKQKTGVVVRDGVILGETTRKSTGNRGWPNLDTLAVFEDGGMKANLCDAYTAQEYLEQSARSVFAFGPILVADGELGGDIKDEDYYPYREPRMAIGMIEPYHYIILTVVGREDESGGARLPWVAQKMIELGVVEAVNLDGGGTAALMFMGEVLNRSSRNLRSVNSLIGFGQSAQIQTGTP